MRKAAIRRRARQDPFDLAAGGAERWALEGVGELLVVRPLAAAALPLPLPKGGSSSFLLLLLLLLLLLHCCYPSSASAVSLELVQSQFIKIPYIWLKTPCRNMWVAPAQAGHRTSPSEGQTIRAQEGSVRSGIACQMIQSLQNIGHPAQTVKFI